MILLKFALEGEGVEGQGLYGNNDKILLHPELVQHRTDIASCNAPNLQPIFILAEKTSERNKHQPEGDRLGLVAKRLQ